MTDTIHTERWPLTFGSASHAVHWADGFLLQPRLESQMGVIMREALERKAPRGVDVHGDVITLARLRDEAETISVSLAGIENPPGTLYRFVYGRYMRTTLTADQVARLVHDGNEHAGISKMRVMAALLMEDCKQRHKFGQRIKWVDIYKQIRVDENTFYRVWRPYAEQIKGHLDAWHDRAERELTEALSDKGVL